MKVTLKNMAKAHTALPPCVRRTVESAAANASGLGIPEHIHILRVTCKRMRAYLRLVRPHMKKALYRRENRRLRDANRALAGSRDAHVLRDTLCLVCPPGLPPFTRESLLPIQASFSALPESAPLGDTIDDTIRVLRSFADHFPHFYPQSVKGWSLLEEGFADTFEGAADAYREALKSRKPGDFHEWRKILKYLRFQSELLLDVEPLIIPGMYDTLIDLERGLGKHHDLHLLAHHVSPLKKQPGQDPETVESVVYAVGRESEACEKQVLHLGRRLFVSEGPDLLAILHEQLG